MDSVSFRRFTPPPTPPCVLPVPFNSITINEYLFPGSYSNTNVHRYLNDLLQVRTQRRDLGFELKIKSCSVWCLTGDSVSIEVFSLFNDNHVAEVIVGHPGRNQWARVGVKWPQSQRERIVVSNGVFFQLLEIYSNNPKARILLHLNLDWRMEKIQVSSWCPSCIQHEDEKESDLSDFELINLSDSDDVLKTLSV